MSMRVKDRPITGCSRYITPPTRLALAVYSPGSPRQAATAVRDALYCTLRMPPHEANQSW
ncbi:hypothetical protein GQ53DRAFT_742727 [Thozetella sp. PMI_491]|nr:hypothetical protein GQ53DRAFT_742727 [Thozetella sp. PMI_491]